MTAQMYTILIQENKGEKETSYEVYEGHHYFPCESTNCAVLVAVDKLTDPEIANINVAKSVRSTSKNEIKLGSLVTFYDSDNCEERGIVRWIGISDNSDLHNGTKIIGIEVVSCVGCEI